MEALNNNSIVEGIKRYYKHVLIIIAGLLILYGFIFLFTRKPQIPAEYKSALDSLAKDNANIRAQQKKVDSTIAQYHRQILDLDYAISNIKAKEVIIKEYYHEVSGKVDKFTPTQVDSFFKARYNY